MTRGMFLSEDAGNSWKQILSRFSVYDLAVDPHDSNIIYAAGSYTNHGRVWLRAMVVSPGWNF